MLLRHNRTGCYEHGMLGSSLGFIYPELPYLSAIGSPRKVLSLGSIYHEIYHESVMQPTQCGNLQKVLTGEPTVSATDEESVHVLMV